MTGPEDRLRDALHAKAASVTYLSLRPALPPAAAEPSLTGALRRRGVRVAALLTLAAVPTATVLLLANAPERPPVRAPAPERTPTAELTPTRAPAPPMATSGRTPSPSPDMPRPERMERGAG